jgi:penicillin amidase
MLKTIAVVLLALILIAVGTSWALLRASLPQLDGAVQTDTLTAPVTIERDNRGVPTVTASSRTDLAFATGFLHGQDRFFQMDLSRRLAAGELSELFGKVALEQDEKARLFRFRQVAQAILQRAPADERSILEAYTRGVNAGLSALRSRPWEYWLLQSPPVAWRAEDTFLVVHAMWWDLQAGGFRREILRHQINDHIGGKACEAGWQCALRFFYPERTLWDAPDDGSPDRAAVTAADANDVPTPDVLDVRTGTRVSATTDLPAAHLPEIGSNNFAVAGRLTATGSALIASDMHLTERVPTIWYHVRLRTKGTAEDTGLDLNGVSLPGTPALVAGSNSHIAWGFTNSYGSWLDVARVACADIHGNSLSVAHEIIHVHGAADVTLDVKSGPLGVLLRQDTGQQNCWFGSWLAQDPAATNFQLMRLERAMSVADALAVAPEIGIPHQNLVVGDREGHIAWTISGRIPASVEPGRSRNPTTWTRAPDHPQLLDPPSGRIWTANARVTSDPRQAALIGADLATLGAEYDLSARARQIRDDLLSLTTPATPADMLRIQLDDRALFLQRWHDLLLQLLDADAIALHPRRAEFRSVLLTWNGRASIDSAAYRLVRGFRDRTELSAWNMLAGALKIPERDRLTLPDQFEHALWLLVTQQPMHLLDARYESWRDFLLEQLDTTIGNLERSCGTLARCTWGIRNTTAIQHPLSPALPLIGPLLDMPTVQLPGDDNMPRVQNGDEGASERFAVSPGYESQGYFHMPGGQSGHPLSPYYRAGFLAWAHGDPLPFLPGPAEHTLTLRGN